jgi:amphi-Trp domain-containing protein
MAETTTYSGELTRSETAAFLRSIADELESGSRTVRIPVGNKDVQLAPSDSIRAETTVTERSRRLRKDVEELDISFRWNPTREPPGAADDSASESDADAGPNR